MRVMEKVQKRRMIEYQKSMIKNSVPRTQRLYQKLIEEDYQEDQRRAQEKAYKPEKSLRNSKVFSAMRKDIEIIDSDNSSQGSNNQMGSAGDLSVSVTSTKGRNIS